MQLLVRVWKHQEAMMIREMLENNGIPVVLQGEHFSAIYPLNLTGVGEVRVLVAEKQLADAEELLKAYFGKEAAR